VGGAGVFGLVDAVAEAGDLLLGGQHVLHVFDRVGAGLVDGVEQAHDALVGAAVQRALERADGAGDGRVDVGQVAAMTRAAKVEAFSSCSACRTSAMSSVGRRSRRA
jgi:hypothetical protein